MQTIHLDVHDSQLEQAMLRLAEQQHQNLQEFVISALSFYIQEKENSTAIKVQKLDPFKHSKAATRNFNSLLI